MWFYLFFIKKILTCALKAQVKKLKTEIFSWNLCIQYCKSLMICVLNTKLIYYLLF